MRNLRTIMLLSTSVVTACEFGTGSTEDVRDWSDAVVQHEADRYARTLGTETEVRACGGARLLLEAHYDELTQSVVFDLGNGRKGSMPVTATPSPELLNAYAMLASYDDVGAELAADDGVGHQAAAAGDSTGGGAAPCGAQCRGTCGADCDDDSCGDTYTSGSQTCVDCSTHSACRDHDSCYDSCNSAFGCSGFDSWMCRRGCDDLCISEWGVSNCLDWANGGGPSDGTITYCWY